jgi:hypothetical protein
MSSSFGGSFASRRDWTGKTSIFTAKPTFTPSKPSGSLASWDLSYQKFGSAPGPSSVSSASSYKNDADDGMNQFGVTSHVPRSAIFASTLDTSLKEENRSNEVLERQLSQIQQTADEYKEEAATLKFHADALKAELEVLQNQHQVLLQSSADNLKLERESANAQLLKSQLQSENLRKNLAALQTKVVESFMQKWRLFSQKNVIFRVMKCWRTTSK